MCVTAWTWFAIAPRTLVTDSSVSLRLRVGRHVTRMEGTEDAHHHLNQRRRVCRDSQRVDVSRSELLLRWLPVFKTLLEQTLHGAA